MKKQSFMFRKESIFKACIKALAKRDFSIVNSDNESGLIQAKAGNGLFEPKIMFEIKVENAGGEATSVNISTVVLKQGLFKNTAVEVLEEKFVDTLYKFVNSKTPNYFNPAHARLSAA